VSCFEVVRAARAVQRWEKSAPTGQVWVHITNETFPDRLSMLYHGLAIGLATNRTVVADHAQFAPLELPAVITNAAAPQEGASLPTDYQFGCADVSPRFPKLQFAGASWPQVMYTHPVVAPYLRANFGYHAAHFLGNYLFGVAQAPAGCVVEENVVIEGWVSPKDGDHLRVSEYERYVGRCGVDSKQARVVTSTEIPTSQAAMYGGVDKIDGNDPKEVVCGLRKLVSAKAIVHTFGSRIGFWGTAMLGVKGGFVNGIDRLCINTTNSQQGSLWHTYVPPEKPWFYRTNTWFYVCGPNVNDARLYVEYLLW
jgi:hypothetical protein